MPKELPTNVQITAAIGQKISGIVKQTVNKNEKQGDEWVPTAETRDENVIEKVFHPELNRTIAEARNGQEEANSGMPGSRRTKVRPEISVSKGSRWCNRCS